MLRALMGTLLLAALAGGVYYFYVRKDDSILKKVETPAAGALEGVDAQAADAAGNRPGAKPDTGVSEPPNADVEGPPNRKGCTPQAGPGGQAAKADPAAKAPQAGSDAVHVVAQGETLGRIARKYYGDEALYTLIAKANKLDRPSRLRVGQKLVIPPKPSGVAGAAGPAVPPAKESDDEGTSPGQLRPATLNKAVPAPGK